MPVFHMFRSAVAAKPLLVVDCIRLYYPICVGLWWLWETHWPTSIKGDRGFWTVLKCCAGCLHQLLWFSCPQTIEKLVEFIKSWRSVKGFCEITTFPGWCLSSMAVRQSSLCRRNIIFRGGRGEALMARHGSFSLRNLQHNPGQKMDFHGRETLPRAGGDWHKQFGVKQVVTSLLPETGRPICDSLDPWAVAAKALIITGCHAGHAIRYPIYWGLLGIITVHELGIPINQPV